MDGKPLKEIIAEGMASQGWSVKKLAESSNIPERYLHLLLEGDLKKLPPAPYVRGYLGKIAQLLELDKNDLWQTYKDEIDGNISGPSDRLPVNRFAIRTFNKKILISGIILLLLIGYFGFNLDKLIGLPSLTVNSPKETTVISLEPVFVIRGKTDTSNKLTINGEQTYLDENGIFAKELTLQEGLNSFEIIAKKFLGGEISVIKKIIFQKNDFGEIISESTPPPVSADQKKPNP